MKKWMKKMAIIGAVLFVGGIGVTSIGAAIGGASAGIDFLLDKEKVFQDKYDRGDSEETFDETEQWPEETDVPEEMDGQPGVEQLPDVVQEFLMPEGEENVQPEENNTIQPEDPSSV